MAQPSKPTYTPEQIAVWKRKHRDFKSGSTRAGTAVIMVNGGARGAMLIPLEAWNAQGEW